MLALDNRVLRDKDFLSIMKIDDGKGQKQRIISSSGIFVVVEKTTKKHKTTTTKNKNNQTKMIKTNRMPQT